ncbi:hypothetical protein [Paraurantiacibacter namhicola]|uniref:Uncharacterized protein n=1 Tax=Paraurantiacibacter namhicola TaxID=645517 RepID=A0A1C7DAI0_9SPHN|nr:hypothetical protein [Paraurantiacibacter namhicola]ANU08313.1 hypothetical protein A6F65_02026 [Paraurantiacibacter namhicola]
MLSALLLALLPTQADAATATPASAFDGTRLHEGQACYAITQDGTAVGFQRETITASTSVEGPAWHIVSEQVMPARKFTFVDHFLLDRSSLQPVAFHSVLGGREIARLSYVDGRVVGRAMDRTTGGVVTVDKAVEPGTLEGNLWSPLLHAAPLERDYSAQPPIFSYSGSGERFRIHVAGEDTIETPAGPRKAWLVEMGYKGGNATTYMVARDDGTVLGSRSGPFGTQLLASCDGVEDLGS